LTPQTLTLWRQIDVEATPVQGLYVIVHELAKGSSKCFKFHYLVSQSILLDIYFLCLSKKKFGRFVAFWFFCIKPWIYTRKFKLAHILCICGSIFTFFKGNWMFFYSTYYIFVFFCDFSNFCGLLKLWASKWASNRPSIDLICFI
jgi:hypothetical protein